MICPKCGSNNTQFIANTKTKYPNIFIMLCVFALCILTFGLFLIFVFIYFFAVKRTQSQTISVCNNCGYQWRVSNQRLSIGFQKGVDTTPTQRAMPQVGNTTDSIDLLIKLKAVHDGGLISDDEYNAYRKEILEKM